MTIILPSKVRQINNSSYVIWKDGKNIFAQNGSTCDIDYKGTDISLIINNIGKVLDSNGQILIKSGSYNITTDLIIPANSIFIGEGSTTKFILGEAGRIHVDYKNNVIISNILVDSSLQKTHIGGGATAAIMVSGSSNVRIDNVIVKDANHFGIYIQVSNNVIIENCTLNGLGNNDVIGGNGTNGMYNLKDVIIRNNIIKQDASIGDLYATTIDLTNVYRVAFLDNMTYGDLWFGSEEYPHRYSRISGNIIKPATGKTSCFIKVSVNPSDSIGDRYISITDNTIENGYIQVAAIGTKWALYGIISNNVIDASKAPYGIRMKYCSEFNIIGNLIIGNKLSLDDATKIIIKGNQFSGGHIGIEELNSTGQNIIEGNYFNNITTPINNPSNTDIIRNNKGYMTENNILSGTFAIDATGLKTISIPHGLSIIPNIEDCYLTVVKDSNVIDWGFDLLIIDVVNTTNVIAKINISKPSIMLGAIARLALRVENV